jgi:hypothetical protein
MSCTHHYAMFPASLMFVAFVRLRWFCFFTQAFVPVAVAFFLVLRPFLSVLTLYDREAVVAHISAYGT